jgi:hypothetical protein
VHGIDGDAEPRPADNAHGGEFPKRLKVRGHHVHPGRRFMAWPGRPLGNRTLHGANERVVGAHAGKDFNFESAERRRVVARRKEHGAEPAFPVKKKRRGGRRDGGPRKACVESPAAQHLGRLARERVGQEAVVAAHENFSPFGGKGRRPALENRRNGRRDARDVFKRELFGQDGPPAVRAEADGSFPCHR